MKRSESRILTTHTGSLPRPSDLLDMLRARESGDGFDAATYESRLRGAVAEIVRQQADSGVDIVSDGELGKPGFFQYVRSRLDGMDLGPRPEGGVGIFADFPDYAEFQTQRFGQLAPAGAGFPVCNGPLAWKGDAELQTQLEALKLALSAVQVEEAFLPSASIGIIAQRSTNNHYATYEEYVWAISDAMRNEYRGIVDAGFVLQIDAPEMVMDKNTPQFRDASMLDYRKRMELWVEALNGALAGLPEDRIRFHICWGNQEGPHTLDVPLQDVVDIMLKVRAGAYSVEASNPRHAHEWRVWSNVKLPEGKVLIPGVIDSTTNFVEHPELIADRIETYARLVGRENVIAGTDCGFGTSAFRNPMVFPPVMWAKFRALAEGAAIATKRLWG